MGYSCTIVSHYAQSDFCVESEAHRYLAGSTPATGFMKTIAEQLNKLDIKYPNIITMPKEVRDKYNELSQQLICQVWDTRLKNHGSIHSHLEPGEKPGKG